MKIGLIGMPNSGKTTIFNALTKSNAEVAAYSSGKVEPNLAVVEVEDPRIPVLSEMYKPKKTIYATIDFIDFVGLSAGAAREGLWSGESMNLIKTADALAIVARNFPDPVSGDPPNPVAEVQDLAAELLLSDQIVAETRLERIRSDFQRGRKTPETQAEEKALTKIATHLDEGLPLRLLELNPDERRILGGFQFMTNKPVMVIINSAEDTYGQGGKNSTELGDEWDAIEFAGEFEMELAGLDDEDAELFMADMGIEESARSRLTTFAYRMLGYISFFTVGDDEVRAWSIRKNSDAVTAAGAIHSDLARGFIRAEVFTYDDLMACGSEKGIKEKGLLRVEGKSYIVQDGDILNIRFSV